LQVLKNELNDTGSAIIVNNQIQIQIGQIIFERQLGNLLQQIYQVIDQHFPERAEHLSVIIKDIERQHEQMFKIWKSS
jgi:hypothetical protein